MDSGWAMSPIVAIWTTTDPNGGEWGVFQRGRERQHGQIAQTRHTVSRWEPRRAPNDDRRERMGLGAGERASRATTAPSGQGRSFRTSDDPARSSHKRPLSRRTSGPTDDLRRIVPIATPLIQLVEASQCRGELRTYPSAEDVGDVITSLALLRVLRYAAEGASSC
jgi:hypothetical protein